MTIFSTRVLGRGIVLVLLGILFSNVALIAQNEDKDGDGFTISAGDCDDYQALVYPGANEIADGQDNNCDGLVDIITGDCDDFTSAGIIDGGETICKAQIPSIIQNMVAPAGGSGEMQVMWIYTTDDPSIRPPQWFIIPNAHDLSYQPSLLAQTTWFGRCVRRSGCWKFPNESNVIEKTVLNNCENNACTDFIASIGATTFPDCDGNLGTTNINVIGGTMPYQFIWSDSITTQNRIDLNGGNYQVTITDANGCIGALELNIPTPTCVIDCSTFATAASSTSPDCDGNLGTIDVTVTDGVAPIVYVWSDGDSTEDRTGLQGGNYQVTITDANGCTGMLELNIPTPSCIPEDCSTFATTVSSTSPDCDGNLGTIDVTVTDGVAPIVYVWSDGDSTEDRTGLQGGNYQVTITDTNGCTDTLELNIPTPSCLPDCSTFATAASSTSPDCDGNLGTIDVTVTDGVAPIVYIWSDGDSTEDRTGLQGGNYQVTITDANGCTDTLELNIPTPSCVPDCSTFATAASSTSPDCDGNLGTIDVTVTDGVGPIVYIWSDGDSTEDRTGLQGGNYQVTITDANGCTDTLELNIPTPSCVPDCSTFATAASSTSPDCDGNLGTIDVTVTDGATPIVYVWSDGDSTEDRTGLQGGNYQVTITDANGCTGTLELNIPTPSCVQDCSTFSTTASSTSPDCDGNLGTIDVTVTDGVAPIVYVWSDGDSTEDRTGLQGGNYQVTITDANGCTGTLELNIPTPSCVPDCSTFATAASSTSPDCDGNLGTIDVTVTDGLAPIVYMWSDGDSTEDRTGLQGGNYQVTITDANGCTGTLELNIPTPSCVSDCSNFVVNVSSIAPDCDGNLGTIDVTVTDGVAPIIYVWSNGDSTEDIAGLQGGTYQVTITDANGCGGVLELNIPTPSCLPDCSNFSVNASSTAPDCDGNLGAIDVTVTDGVAPIVYVWSDGDSTEDRTGLQGGNYQVTITDANGCTGMLELNIPTPSCIPEDCSNFATTVSSTSPDCDGNLGTIDVTVTDGAAPIVYVWSDGDSTEDRTGLQGGNYQVTITDANGCTDTLELNIPTPSCVLDCNAFTAQLIETTLPDCNGNLGSINISFINGLEPVVYQWSDDSTTQNRIGLEGGNYEVILTDANGCSDNLMITIPTPDCAAQCDSFEVIVDSLSSPDCEGNLGSIDLNVVNGLAPLTYAWQDGSTTEDRTGLAGGSYTVTVSDGNACFKVVEIAMPTPNCGTAVCDNFIIPFTTIDVTCEPNSGAINLSAFGGTTPYQYQWADITENIEDRNNLTVGTYELTVTDAANCEKTASITIGTADCVVTLPPFDCAAAFYQIVEGQLNQIDLANDSLIPLGEEAANLNPLGYNVEDDFIYGIRFGTTDLVKIGQNGGREVVGRVQGINVGLLAGDFDVAGNYYLLDNEAQRLQRVDVDATLLVAATIQLSETIPALGDISYHPTEEVLYGVSETGDVVSINPISGDINSFNIAALPTGSVASTWMTNKGEFIVSYNVSQEIYQIDLTNQTAVLIGITGDSAFNADGANCIQAASPLDSLSSAAAFAFRNIASTMTEEMVAINYEVVNEEANAYYLLEYAIDGTNYEALPGVENALGMPLQQYQMMDQHPKLGSGYYRVKYIKEDGTYQYSDPIAILFKQEATKHIIVHPNPFVNEMTINFIEPLTQDAEIMVSNSLGKIMDVCEAKQGTNRLLIDCPNYPAGFYTVYVKVKGKRPIVYRTLKLE